MKKLSLQGTREESRIFLKNQYLNTHTYTRIKCWTFKASIIQSVAPKSS